MSVVLALMSLYFISPFVEALNSHSVTLDNSANQHLSAVDSASLSITGNLTLEMWVNFDSINSGDGILAAKYGGGGSERAYQFGYRDNAGTKQFESRISVDGSGGGTTVKTLDYALATSTWYHLALVYTASAGTVDVYVAPTSTSTHNFVGTMTGHNTSIKDSISQFMLGSSSGEQEIPVSDFDGKMDDVRLWNTTRTVAELDAALYTELTGSESGLAGYWKLNDDLSDSTANGNTLTNNNGAVFSTDVPALVSMPTLTLTATPGTITTGGSSTLSWTSTDTTSCTASNGWSGAKAVSSNEVVTPAMTTTYTLDCSGPGGTVQKSATVTVNPLAPKVRKAADESVASNATLQNDDHLAVGVEAGKSYEVEGTIFVTAANGTPDLKLAFDTPAGTTLMIGYVSAETATNEEVMTVDGAGSARIQIPTNDTVQIAVHGTVEVTASGNLQFQWSQFASNASAVTVKEGSYLKVTEI